MNLVPTRIQEQINRVDRTRSLAIGISAGVAALWSIYRLFWLFYSAAVLSNFGYSSVSLVFSLVLWSVVGIVAGLVSIAFLVRYAKQP
jgi:hypothetical protein